MEVKEEREFVHVEARQAKAVQQAFKQRRGEMSVGLQAERHGGKKGIWCCKQRQIGMKGSTSRDKQRDIPGGKQVER